MVGGIVHHWAFHANQSELIAICRTVEKPGDITCDSVASTTCSPKPVWLPQGWVGVQGFRLNLGGPRASGRLAVCGSCGQPR
jgi:hypothetical protein